MFNFDKIISSKHSKARFGTVAAAALAALLIGSNGWSSSEPSGSQAPGTVTSALASTSGIRVNFAGLAPVKGGLCFLKHPQTGSKIAGPRITNRHGVAIFPNVSPAPGIVLVKCIGGRYIDQATGLSQPAPRTRSYVNITSTNFNATVSPLTEIATRIVRREGLNPATNFPGILANIATSFGLDGINLARVRPINLNKVVADNSDAGHYGVALAVISQLEFELGETTEEEVVATLLSGLANNGQFTRDDIRDLYLDSMEKLFANPRIAANMGLETDLHELFDNVTIAPLASQVDHVDAENSLLQAGQPTHTIAANQRSVFDIVGTHLYLGMTARLGDANCRLRDLESLSPLSHDTFLQVMLAECPAQPAGTADFVVLDRGRLENTTRITISDTAAPEIATQAVTSAIVGTGPSSVLGRVTAEAPGIIPPSAAHNYDTANLEVFNVAGVTVDLIDPLGTVLGTTSTAADGTYVFDGVAESLSVRVIVRAQVRRTRSTPDVGPQYNFVVRDNTTTTTPKQAYQITSPSLTTVTGINTINVRAGIGFDSNGNPLSGMQRQSAPFAILRIINNAAVMLSTVNPNLTLPELNIYWSVRNIAVSGDTQLGQINTSHYSRGGLLPGLFILGAANSDTDEFDQGVMGHEFGHYLQAQLSYSDSPGDSHSFNEFKDASLAFGEGYGTAVGGLLSSGPNSRFYCDVSGNQQRGGFCDDLTQPVEAGEANGFYSERSIIHLMYGIGTIPGQGFTPFFNAFTQIRNTVHSATIFPFLNNYLAANPGVSPQVQNLMATNNIKSSDPFGVLPPGTPADPAINEAASRGAAPMGANDLERLYFTIPLIANVPAPSPTQPPRALSQNEPPFCLNENLRGARRSNGLGMLRRFQVTANFTGQMLLRGQDDNGKTLSEQGVYFSVRNDTGAEISIFGYGGVNASDYYGVIDAEQGRTYTITLHVYNTDIILNGSQCGNRLLLARAADF